MPNPPEEILALAEHHKQILERKFPNYVYLLVDWPDGLCYVDVEVYDHSRALLVASFSTSCVHITRGDPDLVFSNDETVFDYADPRFTENTLSDILTDVLKSWGRAKGLGTHV